MPPVYRSRPRTPSTVGGRPYSPVATSSTQGTGIGDPTIVISHPSSNAHPGSIKQQHSVRGKADPPLPDHETKLRCNCHCFCITIKALSFGLVLLTAGSVMYAAGIFVEKSYIASQGGRPEMFDRDQRATLMMYRNLTYAGPVIMGLGAIVILAGFVLTFEARDTLGIRATPSKPTANASKTAGPVVIAGLPDPHPVTRSMHEIASVSSTVNSGRPPARRPAELNLPMAHITPGSCEGIFDRSRMPEGVQETALTRVSDSGPIADGATAAASGGLSCSQGSGAGARL